MVSERAWWRVLASLLVVALLLDLACSSGPVWALGLASPSAEVSVSPSALVLRSPWGLARVAPRLG